MRVPVRLPRGFAFLETTRTRRCEPTSEIITCPTGLTGRIRGMKVREERILLDRKLAEAGGQVDELLVACCEETADAGPTTSVERSRPGLTLCGYNPTENPEPVQPV